MTDDLLTQFRSAVPLPDEATGQRIYERATSRRRRLPRRRLFVAIALVAAAGVAVGLSTTVVGGAKHPPAPGVQGDIPFGPITNFSVAREGRTITSISFTLGDDNISNAKLAIDVLRLDPAHPTLPVGPTGAGSAPNGTVVFEEQVPMTNTGSTTPSTAVSTWSGTLFPRDWDGGCQNALYDIETTVYPATLPSDDPFDPGTMNRYHPAGMFRCRSN